MVGFSDYRSARNRGLLGTESKTRITAVLGPTNTGKTHLAVERMLGHHSGMIGLPLRLLAREVYDRVVAVKGKSSVALITGEEKILPPRATHYVCTVESMPLDATVAFMAVDEIQLCADPERGHIFTDRLLRARGTEETMFLGADTMRAIIRHLLPDVEFVSRPRFSRLEHAGHRKLSRLPRRSAIVAFSISEIYQTAELVRRQRGGAAVVMGALSPRTRNAQVELYESGEVDFIVATDAIGMGLNLNVAHVAFVGLSKFDGRGVRELYPSEIAQIAGRAGRHLNDGTFGTTGDARPIDPAVIEMVTEHRFPTVEILQWRNTDLAYGSVTALIKSLHHAPPSTCLRRTGENEDLYVLRTLARDPSVIKAARGPAAVRLLWEVCRIPDFRKTMRDVHARLLGDIFSHLISGDGVLPTDWFARHIDRLDRVDGDIDTLQARLAHVRTWNYVSNRPGWLPDPSHWQERVLEIEDRLSNALHISLTQRFVDHRGLTLARRRGIGDDVLTAVDKDGRVLVDGEFVGELRDFSFQPDPDAEDSEQKALRSAARNVLAGEIDNRADIFARTEDREFSIDSGEGETGPTIVWHQQPLARIVRGRDALAPEIRLLPNDFLTQRARTTVEARLNRWFADYLKRQLAPLLRLRDNAEADPDLDGGARGLAYQLVEQSGAVPRRTVAGQLKVLSHGGRKALRGYGVCFGERSIYLPALFKAAPARLRFDLWKLYRQVFCALPAPDPSLMSVPADKTAPHGFYPAAGLTVCGQRAVRIDILDRLARALRAKSRKGPFPMDPALMSLVGCGSDAFGEILVSLGYQATEMEGETRIAPAPRKPSTPRKKDQKIEKRGTRPGTAAFKAEKQIPRVKQKPQQKRQEPPIIDQDSPFAVLRDLKKKMQRRGDPRRRRAKSA